MDLSISIHVAADKVLSMEKERVPPPQALGKRQLVLEVHESREGSFERLLGGGELESRVLGNPPSSLAIQLSQNLDCID